MKLSQNDLIRLRLSKDINFSYFVDSFKDFSNTAHHANYYRRDSKHLGFIQDATSARIGYEFEGKRWSSTHRFFQPWAWERTEDDPVVNPWVLFFMGIDDFSFFKRFKTLEQLESYWDHLEILDSLDGLTFFN